MKRFEQVDKRFGQMQIETAKRFDQLTSRMDHFMIWSFATTLTVGGIVPLSQRTWQMKSLKITSDHI